jgi:TP53 regulating kinase-like protein
MGKTEQLRRFKKGAEASLYLSNWHGEKVVVKKRLPKIYRLPQLDERIRKYRTVHEPQLMHEAKKSGVPTPTIFSVDIKEASIVMRFIGGKQIKQLLSEASPKARQNLCLELGRLIGKLHKQGIVHGDLTTSNMIEDHNGKIFFVDFGLGEKTTELEDRGVDLHLMKRALQSVHFKFADECFKAIINGYSEVLDHNTVGNVLGKIKEIEKRGRYVTERRSEQE